MKAKLKPWRFEIAWSNPYTNPPDGEPRVLMSVTHVQGGADPVPEGIARRYAELGYGSGWCITCGIEPTTKRKSGGRGRYRPNKRPGYDAETSSGVRRSMRHRSPIRS